MLLKVTHTTDLSYSDLISESVMELRMCPRQEEGQHRLSFALAVGPRTVVTSYFDWLGNTVHAFTVNAFHRQIRIVATSVLETQRFRVYPEDLIDTYPLDQGSFSYDAWDFLQFSGPVSDSPAVRALAQEVAPRPGESLGIVAQRIMDLLNDRVVYKSGVTTASSTISEVLDHRSGVCQDFTHLMIGMARALKIPARYVSGLIHPDRERYRGFSETHAWCELLFPSIGWIGFDPTNDILVENDHIVLAVGRDFSDVSPIDGIIVGSRKQKLAVAVDVLLVE